MINPRRHAREMALQMLFQTEFNENSDMDPKIVSENSISNNAQSYAEKLVQGVLKQKTSIDNLIQEASTNWKMGRMSFVDRNILRIAVYEILYLSQNVPVKSAINEALEISKRFSTTESRAFINGLLDQIAKTKGT